MKLLSALLISAALATVAYADPEPSPKEQVEKVVSDAKVTQSLDDEVDACVAKTMKTLTFPSPGQQVKMKYPFDFHK